SGGQVKISSRGQYGLRALAVLAKRHGRGPTQVREIARAEGLSAKYLEQLLGRLRAGGLVTSVRGARGGYQLSREPGAISARAGRDRGARGADGAGGLGGAGGGRRDQRPLLRGRRLPRARGVGGMARGGPDVPGLLHARGPGAARGPRLFARVEDGRGRGAP